MFGECLAQIVPVFSTDNESSINHNNNVTDSDLPKYSPVVKKTVIVIIIINVTHCELGRGWWGRLGVRRRRLGGMRYIKAYIPEGEVWE